MAANVFGFSNMLEKTKFFSCLTDKYCFKYYGKGNLRKAERLFRLSTFKSALFCMNFSVLIVALFVQFDIVFS